MTPHYQPHLPLDLVYARAVQSYNWARRWDPLVSYPEWVRRVERILGDSLWKGHRLVGPPRWQEYLQ